MIDTFSVPLHSTLTLISHNDPKYFDRQLWADSVDPDQTAARGSTVYSGVL